MFLTLSCSLYSQGPSSPFASSNPSLQQTIKKDIYSFTRSHLDLGTGCAKVVSYGPQDLVSQVYLSCWDNLSRN